VKCNLVDVNVYRNDGRGREVYAGENKEFKCS